jgi:hypothetical protein
MTPTIADIAWPGPRPISFEKEGGEDALKALVGREEELEELRSFCQTYSVIEITAPSGVGKTSFLAGAMLHLHSHGVEMVKAMPWMDAIDAYEGLGGEATADHDPLPLYCISLGLPRCGSLSELRGAVRALDEEKRCVCVFDQMEELLRYERALGANLLELIGRVAAGTRVPHLVVARTEFRDQLRPVEVREAPTWHMLLPELSDPEVIRNVVERPVPDGVALEDGVAERVVAWWKSARSQPRSGELHESPYPAASECGLLHLQALLWALRCWAVESPAVDPQLLTVANLEEYAVHNGLSPDPSEGGGLMADALRSYIASAIAGFKSNAWPNGPRLMLARAAGHLSSAGFKVAQPVSNLVARAIQEELGSSKSGWDGSDRFDIDKKKGREKAAAFFADRFQIDPAGVGKKWSREQVAYEIVTALDGVLKRLSEPGGPNVLRRYRHGEDSIYELVHDGVAPALDGWAEKVLEEPIALLGGICIRRGEIFDRDLDSGTFLDDGGGPRPYWSGVSAREVGGKRVAAISGIGWHGLGVHHPDKADPDEPPDQVLIEDVVFEDCDFTGTLFKGVVFRNVCFERCEMRGVAMLDCAFHDVAFNRSPMVGAAINRGTFHRASFDCTGEPGAMNYVSIETAKPGAIVAIRNLKATAGIFLVGLAGGDWSLKDVDLSYLAFESVGGQAGALRLGPNCDLAHAKIEASAGQMQVECAENVRIANLTGDTPIIPPDALGQGAATSG